MTFLEQADPTILADLPWSISSIPSIILWDQIHETVRSNYWSNRILFMILHPLGIVQVNLCQKLLFLHQLTHNMTADCSLNYKFNTWRIHAQTWGEHVVYRNCFWHSEQFSYRTCSPHVLQEEELLTKIYLYIQFENFHKMASINGKKGKIFPIFCSELLPARQIRKRASCIKFRYFEKAKNVWPIFNL